MLIAKQYERKHSQSMSFDSNSFTINNNNNINNSIVRTIQSDSNLHSRMNLYDNDSDISLSNDNITNNSCEKSSSESFLLDSPFEMNNSVKNDDNNEEIESSEVDKENEIKSEEQNEKNDNDNDNVVCNSNEDIENDDIKKSTLPLQTISENNTPENDFTLCCLKESIVSLSNEINQMKERLDIINENLKYKEIPSKFNTILTITNFVVLFLLTLISVYFKK